MKKILIIISLILILWIAWWLLSPLFLNKKVNEAFPEPVTNQQSTAAPDQKEDNQDQSSMLIASGNFRDADSFHKGSGKALIYKDHQSNLLLRLEDFQVTNGPDLYVFLSPHSDPKLPSEVKTEGYLNLGRLKGNMGNQNYDIPQGTEIDQFESVVIYCLAFNVTFSVASLSQ